MKTPVLLLLAALLLFAPGHATAELPPDRCEEPLGYVENCPPGTIGGPARAEVCDMVVTGTCFPL